MSDARSQGSRGSRALLVSALLGVLALGGAVCALLVGERAVLAVLAVSACVGFAATIAALVSFGARRVGPSLAALAASLVILAGIGAAIAASAVGTFVGTIEERRAVRPYVDEQYRFQLMPLGSNAVAYPREVLRRNGERTVARMRIPALDATVSVLVELAYDRPLERVAREEIVLARPEEPVSTVILHVHHLGRDAVRVQRTFAATVVDSRLEESTFFLHEGRVYAVLVEADGRPADEGTLWFHDALTTFTLLDGAVHDRAEAPLVSADDGPGWRVRAQVFESGDHALSVDGTGYALRYGESARTVAHDARVVIERRNPDVSLVIASVHLGGRDAAEVEDELYADASVGAETAGLPPRSVSVSGASVELAAQTRIDGRTWHERVGVLTDRERAYRLVVSAPTREIVEADLAALLARVRVVRGVELDGLRAELDARPDPWQGVGDDWSIKSGVITHHAEGIRWRRPNARWRGAVTHSWSDEGYELVSLEAPSLGLAGSIVREDLEQIETPDTRHRRVLSTLVGQGDAAAQTDGSAPHTFGIAPGWLSARIDDGGEHLSAIGTAVRGVEAYRIEVWGTRRDFDVTAARAAITGLEVLEPTPTRTYESGVHRDERMGYRLEVPWPDVGPSTDWSYLDQRVGSLFHVARAGESIAILAAPVDRTMGPSAQADELLASEYPELLRERELWRERDGSLAGRPCRVRERSLPFGLGGITVWHLVERGIHYLLIVNDRNRLDPARAARGFALLD